LTAIRWADCPVDAAALDQHQHVSFVSRAYASRERVTVQALMGHSTIQMTMRYAHPAPGGGQEFIAALDGSNGNLTATRTSNP